MRHGFHFGCEGGAVPEDELARVCRAEEFAPGGGPLHLGEEGHRLASDDGVHFCVWVLRRVRPLSAERGGGIEGRGECGQHVLAVVFVGGDVEREGVVGGRVLLPVEVGDDGGVDVDGALTAVAHAGDVLGVLAPATVAAAKTLSAAELARKKLVLLIGVCLAG